MIRDPFYRDIIDGLNRRLDPEAFEQCAADLLRDVFPGLVPIRGGGDAGMDGAIADRRGLAFPLASTTAKHTLGNLTHSLHSYLAQGGKRRQVVFATSRQLSAVKRRNHEKRADELGFELTQIFDQAAIANLLYRAPQWCKELLNLSGEAPPISAVPLTRRPLPSGELIGRKEEIAWLRSRKADCILVGPPGSGKTALAHTLVTNDGLFLVSDNVASIAPEIRRLKPAWVIVDDAHVSVAQLDLLRQVRQQIQAEFGILATCWSAGEDLVRDALGVASVDVRRLAGLDRDDLVEVVRRAGVRGPTRLVREIVDQAGGRPGLAVTLATLCLRGETHEVVLGDTIARQTRASFEQLIGPQATRVLAALALGGNGGMRQKAVAQALGIGLAEFHHVVTSLAAGGVIEEAANDVLVVRPDALRHALVRDLFFGTAPMGLDSLRPAIVSVDGFAETLACARAVGARVSQQILLHAFDHCYSASTWGWFASLGEDEARWILSNRPDLAQDRDVSHALLQRTPGEALPALMEQIAADRRNSNSFPEHPMRRLEGWVRVVEAATGERIRRRRILLRSASNWIASGRDNDVGWRAVGLTFSPKVEDNESDPGSGNRLTIRSGLLPLPELKELCELWPEATALVDAHRNSVIWNALLETIREWAYPHMAILGRGKVSPAIERLMRRQATRMLRDLAVLGAEHAGVRHQVARIAQHAKLRVRVSLDKDFELLFPLVEFKDYLAFEKRHARRVRGAAALWVRGSPEAVAQRIASLLDESRLTEGPAPNFGYLMCAELAARVDDCGAWLRAFVEGGLPGNLLHGLIARVARARPDGWETLVLRCLEQDHTRAAAAGVVLTLPDPPPPLLQPTLHIAATITNVIEHVCHVDDVPHMTLIQLLSDADEEVRAAAAIGTWMRYKGSQVPDAIRRAWEATITRCAGKLNQSQEYWLTDLLKADEALAVDWLVSSFGCEDWRHTFWVRKVRGDVLRVIGPLARAAVLTRLGQQVETHPSIVRDVIQADAVAYAAMLGRSELRNIHLAPLCRSPDEKWVQLAEAALNAGYSPADVARAPFNRDLGGWEKLPDSETHGWAKLFRRLQRATRKELREVGRIGRATASAL